MLLTSFDPAISNYRKLPQREKDNLNAEMLILLSNSPACTPGISTSKSDSSSLEESDICLSYSSFPNIIVCQYNFVHQ
jgi:hypothetical protein